MTWRGFYINLDRSQARREDMEAQLGQLGLADRYQRFSAIDGANLPAGDEGSNSAERACYMSHLDVISRNVGSDQWLHVLEDDTLLSRHASSAISLVTSSADCARYDMIFTNVTLHSPIYVMAQFCSQYDQNVQFDDNGAAVSSKITVAPLAGREFVTASSYLVNPASTAKVAQLLQARLNATPFTPIDLALSNLSMAGALAVGCTIPFFTLPRWDVQSTIRDWEDVRTTAPLLIAGAALFMDRDAGALRAQLETALQSTSLSVTSTLVANAYALVLGGWLTNRPADPG